MPTSSGTSSSLTPGLTTFYKRRTASSLWTQKSPPPLPPHPQHLFPLWRVSCGSSADCVLGTHQTGSCTAHTSNTSSGFPQLPARPTQRPGGSRAISGFNEKAAPSSGRNAAAAVPAPPGPACITPGCSLSRHQGHLLQEHPLPMAPTCPRPPERPTINLHGRLQLGPRHREAQPLLHQRL